jgi:thiol-disulfide isomerase/thioredoxin
MKYNWVIIFVILFISCKDKKSSDVINVISNKEINVSIEDATEVNLEVYDFNGFKKFLNKKDDKIYVVNFWATWCAPCVKELPYFEDINQVYQSKNVEVILVSLDFPHLYDSKLKPFIKDNNLKSKVIALDDADMNTWIPQIDKNWSGSIPATIIYNKNDSKFFEQSFTYEGLENEIIKLLN